jgi:hypothetical protein
MLCCSIRKKKFNLDHKGLQPGVAAQLTGQNTQAAKTTPAIIKEKEPLVTKYRKAPPRLSKG